MHRHTVQHHRSPPNCWRIVTAIDLPQLQLVDPVRQLLDIFCAVAPEPGGMQWIVREHLPARHVSPRYVLCCDMLAEIAAILKVRI